MPSDQSGAPKKPLATDRFWREAAIRQKIRVDTLRGYTEGAEGKQRNSVAAAQSRQTRGVIRTCP